MGKNEQFIEVPVFPSKEMGENMHLTIWLPASADPEKKLAVLYMNDGENLFDSTRTWNKQEWKMDETLSRLLRSEKVRATMVVGIHNLGKRRLAQYMPKKVYQSLSDSSWLFLRGMAIGSGMELEPLLSDKYLAFVVNELKPFIDSLYPTLPDRGNTFMGGSGLGGLISMYAICEYPHVFGGVMCISSHWPGTVYSAAPEVPLAYVNYLNEHMPDPEHHRFYFDYGTAETDSSDAPYQHWVDSCLQAHDYGSENLETLEFPGAEHNENFWSRRLDTPLTFLLKMDNE